MEENINQIQNTNDIEKVLKENNKYRPIYTFGFIVVLILVSIAYASLAYNLGYKVGEVKGAEVPPAPPAPPVVPIIPIPDPVIPDLNWQIEFENVVELEGSVTPTLFPQIDDRKTTVDFGVQLDAPGDFYMFNVDIINKGDRDAKIYDIFKTELTEAQSKYLKFKVYYSNGVEIQIGDQLNVNDRRTVTVLVEFDPEVNKEDLPDSVQSLYLEYKIQYVEK